MAKASRLNKPGLRSLVALGRGGACAAMALVPVLAFVAMLNPGGPLRGTRSPDPLPLPDATAGGLTAETVAQLDFAALSFAVTNEDRTTQSADDFFAQAPAAIKALDGCTVQLTGYMIPVELEAGHVRRCVIVPSQANCCYGVSPRFCEFVVATMSGDDVPLALDVPVTFTGVLRVGDGGDGDAWSAFYTLDCRAAVEK